MPLIYGTKESGETTNTKKIFAYFRPAHQISTPGAEASVESQLNVIADVPADTSTLATCYSPGFTPEFVVP